MGYEGIDKLDHEGMAALLYRTWITRMKTEAAGVNDAPSTRFEELPPSEKKAWRSVAVVAAIVYYFSP